MEGLIEQLLEEEAIDHKYNIAQICASILDKEEVRFAEQMTGGLERTVAEIIAIELLDARAYAIVAELFIEQKISYQSLLFFRDRAKKEGAEEIRNYFNAILEALAETDCIPEAEINPRKKRESKRNRHLEEIRRETVLAEYRPDTKIFSVFKGDEIILTDFERKTYGFMSRKWASYFFWACEKYFTANNIRPGDLALRIFIPGSGWKSIEPFSKNNLHTQPNRRRGKGNSNR